MHLTSGAQALLTYWCTACRTRDKGSLDTLRGRRGGNAVRIFYGSSKLYIWYVNIIRAYKLALGWPSSYAPWNPNVWESPLPALTKTYYAS